jgi:hypothetical protein
MFVYIGGRWVLTKLGTSQNGQRQLNMRTILKILGALSALILLCAGIEYIFHTLSLTRQAIEDMQSSKDGNYALGAPIQTGLFISGGEQTKGDNGAASLSIPVKGSRASGELEVKGIKKEGSWHIVDLYLVVDGDKSIVQIPH